jgi:SpoVK/Ycf46/Vps4 family AAA+-type ATPase
LLEENIGTIEHLRSAAANDTCWEKLSSVKHLVKQMIRDYVQLNAASSTFNVTTNPYEDSKATLYGNIHRLRRYFHHVTGTVKHIANLDRRAVDLAITEIRRTYDDDGNVLNTIHAYLRTFCLRNVVVTSAAHEQQRRTWTEERHGLREKNEQRCRELEEQRKQSKKAADDVKLYELRLHNIIQKEKQVETQATKLITEACSGMTSTNINGNWMDKHDQAKRMRDEYKKERREAEVLLERTRNDLAKHIEPYQILATKIAEDEAQIRDLDAFLKLDLADEHRKLTVKFGRGLLLYGPPGTGKSELLKRAAIFAGITMTTTPLAAGELNRPYVGETEKLLVDIMYRANTIPYLICAMTIDEIDGLVPKRDNNAQQSKVDGISVLLSHIEGVKNIPNLIVFGATNRRNMMDEAFLRRMQAKCFVGRPSPQIRKKMLQSLLCKDSRIFSSKRIDFLVKITTNFSGAAVGALKSSIIVAMDQYQQPQTLTDHTLLELADNAAREFSCWFGIGTLPGICRLQPDIFSSDGQQEDYSLKLPNTAPSGRILVDLQAGKCLIEHTKEPTLEKTLGDEETSTLKLLSRFINGCSSRNIDTIQIIDLNFLIKQNASDENQIFEVLTTTFLGKS